MQSQKVIGRYKRFNKTKTDPELGLKVQILSCEKKHHRTRSSLSRTEKIDLIQGLFKRQ